MQTNLLLLATTTLDPASSGNRGPATRVGRGIDDAFDYAGHDVIKAGQTIQNLAR